MKERRTDLPERELSIENLSALAPQIRRILKKLLNKDPECKIKVSQDGSTSNFEVLLSNSMTFEIESIQVLREKSEGLSLENTKERDEYYKLKKQIEFLGKLKKTVSQWRQLVEDVLNKKRKPPREKPTKLEKTTRGRLYLKPPKKLLRSAKNKWRGYINPKSAPYSRV